jgi:hypothetical protein
MRPLALLKDGWRNWEWEFGGLGGLASCQEFIRGAAPASVKEEEGKWKALSTSVRVSSRRPAFVLRIKRPQVKVSGSPEADDRVRLWDGLAHTHLYIFLQPSNKINTECNAINTGRVEFQERAQHNQTAPGTPTAEIYAIT